MSQAQNLIRILELHADIMGHAEWTATFRHHQRKGCEIRDLPLNDVRIH
jgi:hypothetical protein